MADVFDYLRSNSDKLFTEINDIDVLIFNRISYFPLEEVMSFSEKITVHDAYLRCVSLSSSLYSSKKDIKLFKMISNSNRYKDLYISNVESKFSTINEEQFMAVVIHLPNDHLYISYRGTTSDLVGWKEDFNMAYMMGTPSQIDAVDYLKKINIDKTIYLGGHSKGGNLAMYAAMYSSQIIKDKIEKVYNFDGPGFINLDEFYYSIRDKIVSYIPTCSIIGRLFYLDNPYIVVRSSYNRIWQHSVYSWQIDRDNFIISELDYESDRIKRILDEWLNKTSFDERRDFVNEVYKILIASGVSKISEFNVLDLKRIILSYSKMDNDKKQLLIEVIGYLLESTKENIILDIYDKKW